MKLAFKKVIYYICVMVISYCPHIYPMFLHVPPFLSGLDPTMLSSVDCITQATLLAGFLGSDTETSQQEIKEMGKDRGQDISFPCSPCFDVSADDFIYPVHYNSIFYMASCPELEFSPSLIIDFLPWWLQRLVSWMLYRGCFCSLNPNIHL